MYTVETTVYTEVWTFLDCQNDIATHIRSAYALQKLYGFLYVMSCNVSTTYLCMYQPPKTSLAQAENIDMYIWKTIA